MSRDGLRQTANIISVVLALAVNILAVTLPLNGQETGAISDRFKVYFVPAGYVFSIWGVIYVGWVAFTVFQARPSQKDNIRLQRLGYALALSGVLNAAWLFCWHYNLFGLSVLVMLALLFSLIVAYRRLEIGVRPVNSVERWCVHIPVSTYLGWISVATIANISDWLYLVRWDGFGIPTAVWAVIMLVVACALGALMVQRRGDAAYVLVLLWAFVGIAVKQRATPLVADAAWISALIATVLALSALVRPRGRRSSLARG